MGWQSLDQLKIAYGIDVAAPLDEVRAVLVQQMALVHPDHNSGEFENDAAKALYHSITSAIEYVDSLPKAEPNLPAQIQGLPLAVFKQRSEFQAVESELRKTICTSAKEQYVSKRVGSALIGAGILGVLGFSKTLSSAPFVSEFLSYAGKHVPLFEPAIGFVLFSGAVIAGIFFAQTWIEEQRATQVSSSLLTDRGIAALFRGYPFSEKLKKGDTFTTGDILEVLQGDDYKRRSRIGRLVKTAVGASSVDWKYIPRYPLFKKDDLLAQRVVDAIIAKLESRGAVQENGPGRIVPEYQFTSAAKSQLTSAAGGATGDF
jgi:hypothetical protein